MSTVQVAISLQATWTHMVRCSQPVVYDRPPDSPWGCVVQQYTLQEQSCKQDQGCSQGITLETMCICRFACLDMPKVLVCWFCAVFQSCTISNLPDSRSFKMPCVASSEACLRSRLNESSFKPCSAVWDASLYLSRPASTRWQSLLDVCGML